MENAAAALDISFYIILSALIEKQYFFCFLLFCDKILSGIKNRSYL